MPRRSSSRILQVRLTDSPTPRTITNLRSPLPRGALLALVALILGLAAGILVATTASAAGSRLVAMIAPIGVLWVNAIRMTVIPLIVASLIVATAGTEARAVGRLGIRAFVVFLGLLGLLAVLAIVAAPALFDGLTIGAGAAESIRAGVEATDQPALPSFADWLTEVIPVNPVRAATEGAMLPLVVFSLAFGVALSRLSTTHRTPVVAFFSAVSDAMLLLVGWILVVAPLGIFALALPLAARLGTGVVGAVGVYLAAHSGLLLLATLALYVIVALFSRVSVRAFARAALAPQLVAVTTRSSMAALPANIVAAERGLGLPRSLVSFALPFAVSVFRLNQPISWLAMALFAAKLYGVDLEMTSIVTLAVSSVLLSFSVPGIPSGSLFIVAPFFAAHGIPAESIGVLIALDVVPDVFKTLCNVTGHLTAVTLLRGTIETEASIE
jgi:proton glutamate symport protein